MRKQFSEHMREQAERADAVPAQLNAISDTIGHLRDRLIDGDPDFEPDELVAAIDQAEQKRRYLEESQPAAKQSAKLIAMLPKAAKKYRRQKRHQSCDTIVSRQLIFETP